MNPRSGKLCVSQNDLERHLEETYRDNRRNIPLDHITGLIYPCEPEEEFDLKPLTLSEVGKIIDKTRSKSAPGPNGVPYVVYKRCPEVLKRLYRLLRSAFDKEHISREWKRADGVYIPKEQNSTEIGQFRPISLLNVEGKIFFAVLAKRLTDFLLRNGYVDTTVQKGGVPGMPRCLEHSTMIWEAIQRAKSGKHELHVIWLDLANAYGSVPHQLLWQALEMYHVPETVITMLQAYFTEFQMRFTAEAFTTNWMPLEIGIAMGCTVSPILFVMAMQVLLKASEKSAPPLNLGRGCYMPPLKAFMDDTTVLTASEDEARTMLGRLEDLINWSRMAFKPKKSRSLSIRKGKVDDRVSFIVADQKIPTLSQEPVKSLGRQYDESLKDKIAARNTEDLVVSGLQKIQTSGLIGKFKLWCLQFMLIPKLLWPLLIYDIPISTVERLEAKINKFTRKWLGVPPGLTDVALYGKETTLKLPFKSLVDEYKAGKARLAVMLQDSTDEFVKTVEPTLKTGRKWKVKEAVESAKQILELKEIIGHTQTTRRGFGSSECKMWSKADAKERRSMVTQEIRREQEQSRLQKAVQQGQQGQWTTWDDALQRSLTWNDIWHMAPLRISFIIRAVYDVLPTNSNLVRWNLAKDSNCQLCGERQTLAHVLSSCKIALAQGRYTWRHNKVLKELSAAVYDAITKANSKSGPKTRAQSKMQFVKAGYRAPSGSERGLPSTSSLLDTADDWQLSVDLPGLQNYPRAIGAGGQRPDMVLFSDSTGQFILIELTVPFEPRMGESHVFKEAKYQDLIEELRKNGKAARIFAVEVGTRGFVSSSVYDLLKRLGINGQRRSRVLKGLAESAEKASNWIWQMRNQMQSQPQ